MSKIVDLLGRPRTISIELWPPRTPKAEAHLQAALVDLSRLEPAFTSITYGAGGSTRDRTHELVVQLQEEGRTVPMAHLVCAAHTKAELLVILRRYRDAGVENVLALRGDPPLASDEILPEGELKYAVELAGLAKEAGDFCVAVAAHPGGHPDSPDLDTDLDYLARKLEVADFAITQFLFSPEDYWQLREGLSKRGITKPLVPGIQPITNPRALSRMAQMSGHDVPEQVALRIEAAGDNPPEVHKVGVEMATQLAEKLLAEGVPGLHFYTMNQSAATIEICTNLGIAAGLRQ